MLIEHTPFFTDDHIRLAASVRRFAAREIEPHAAAEEAETDTYFRRYLAALAAADLLSYSVARAGDTGASTDVRALCLVREELAYSSSLADLAFVMQGLGTHAIANAATEHVRDFWLERARTGKSIAAFALTEPEAGSDVASLQTTARRDGDTYIINGHKRYISNAGLADFYTVFARTGTDERGRAQISAFVVSSRMTGVHVRERTQMIAAHPIGALEFDDVRVPAEDRVGLEGAGYSLAMRTLGTFRASVGAAACGMARRALDEAIAYAKTRKQFGKPLAEHQMIQDKLATMSADLDAARLLVYQAAYAHDDTAAKNSATAHNTTRHASTAKLFATEAAGRIVDSAMQIHGGAGMIHNTTIERLYRDVRALRIYEGTSEIQKLIIAGQMLKRE